MKGRITAKFFIDKNGKFSTKLDIRKQPEDLQKFLNAAAVSMLRIVCEMEEIYGNNHRPDGVPGVRGAGAEFEN